MGKKGKEREENLKFGNGEPQGVNAAAMKDHSSYHTDTFFSVGTCTHMSFPTQTYRHKETSYTDIHTSYTLDTDTETHTSHTQHTQTHRHTTYRHTYITYTTHRHTDIIYTHYTHR